VVDIGLKQPVIIFKVRRILQGFITYSSPSSFPLFLSYLPLLPLFSPSCLVFPPIGPYPSTSYLTNMYTINFLQTFYNSCRFVFVNIWHCAYHPRTSVQRFIYPPFSTAMSQHRLNPTECTVNTSHCFYQNFLILLVLLKDRQRRWRRRRLQCNLHRSHTGLPYFVATRTAP
jgi:hypothetical protein